MKHKSEIQIFLAHANEDKSKVLRLYSHLKKIGYKPWIDEKDLIPGQNWRVAIPKIIQNSHIFIACFSQESTNKRGYLQKELRIALNHYAEMPPGAIYLIPLRFNDCEIPDLQLPSLGVNISDLHWVDYWKIGSFETLEKAIEYQFGPFALKPRKIFIKLKSERRVDYTNLQNFLASGKWKKADEETYNVMNQAVKECIGEADNAYLVYQAVKLFPCTDLRTIDQLWNKYSDGHFGFSVQKRIIDEIISKRGMDYRDLYFDGNSPCSREFSFSLATKLGWIINDKLSDIQFSLDVPQGYLPTITKEIIFKGLDSGYQTQIFRQMRDKIIEFKDFKQYSEFARKKQFDVVRGIEMYGDPAMAEIFTRLSNCLVD